MLWPHLTDEETEAQRGDWLKVIERGGDFFHYQLAGLDVLLVEEIDI